jgi:hypothetical protein
MQATAFEQSFVDAAKGELIKGQRAALSHLINGKESLVLSLKQSLESAQTNLKLDLTDLVDGIDDAAGKDSFIEKYLLQYRNDMEAYTFLTNYHAKIKARSDAALVTAKQEALERVLRDPQPSVNELIDRRLAEVLKVPRKPSPKSRAGGGGKPTTGKGKGKGMERPQKPRTKPQPSSRSRKTPSPSVMKGSGKSVNAKGKGNGKGKGKKKKQG